MKKFFIKLKNKIGRTKTKRPDLVMIDHAYALGARTERLRIIEVMNEMIVKNQGMDSWTALLRQMRDSLQAHHDSFGKRD